MDGQWLGFLHVGIRCACGGCVEEVGAFHAVPAPGRYVIQADAVGVVRRVACVAKKQYFGSFGAVTDGTRSFRFFGLVFGVLFEPLSQIKLVGLFLVLDAVGVYFEAWEVCVRASRTAVTRISSLTIDLRRNADLIERGAADGAGVGVLGPRPDAPIMHDMITPNKSGNVIVVVRIWLDMGLHINDRRRCGRS